jgi:hypothetical protein
LRGLILNRVEVRAHAQDRPGTGFTPITKIKDETGIANRIAPKSGGRDAARLQVTLDLLEQQHGTTFRFVVPYMFLSQILLVYPDT